jgi:hypothetical protein
MLFFLKVPGARLELAWDCSRRIILVGGAGLSRRLFVVTHSFLALSRAECSLGRIHLSTLR